MGRRIRIRRLARGLGIAAGVIIGLVVVLTAVVFVRPAREAALREILEIASNSLPGTLSYESASWPGLSRLELIAVAWQDEETEFATADRIAVDVDLPALLRKDLHVRALALQGVSADVPRIEAALPAQDAEDPATTDADGPTFPREGSIPGLPSIAVDSLRLEVSRLAAGENMTFELSLSLAVDTQNDHAPVLAIRSLDAAWIERDWTVRSDGFEFAVASGEFSGRIEAALAELVALDLMLESPELRAFRLTAVERESTDRLLVIDGEFDQRPNGLVTAARFNLDLEIPASSRIDSLISRPGAVAPLDRFGRVLVEAEGDVTLEGELEATARIGISGSDWPGGFEARLRQRAAETLVDEFRLFDEGVTVSGSANHAPGRYSASVEGELTSIAFLERLGYAEEVPDDLRLHLELDLESAGNLVRPDILLRGSAASAGLDSLDLAASGTVEGAESDLLVAARALVREQLAIGIDARVRDLEQPKVHLAPIRVRDSLTRLDRSGAGIPDSPNLRIDAGSQIYAADELRVTGGLGELVIDGQVSRAEGGRGSLQVRWPVPPEALELLGFTEDARDSLLAPTWSRDGFPGIDLTFEIEPEARGASIDMSLALPAPWTALPGLAPEAYEVEPLRGSATARWEQTSNWIALLDFAETAWLDSAFVHLHGFESRAVLDSMLVRGGPVRATAAATLDSSRVDGKFQLDLHSHPALNLVAPDLPPDLEFLMNLRAGIQGDPAAPDARAKLLASARSAALRLPLISVEAEVIEGVPESARIEIPERAQVGQLAIERAMIAAHPEDPQGGLFPLGMAAEIAGDVIWTQLARIDSVGSAWTVRTDSLRLGTRGHVLESLQPFTFEISPADSTLRLDGMRLAGEPGKVDASFDFGPGRAQADVELHLDASIPSAFVQMPARMMPTGYHLVATGNEDDLEASLWIEGIKLGARNDIVARIDSRRDDDQVSVQVDARDELGRIAQGELTLPMKTDLVARHFAWHGGPLEGKVQIDSLPLPYRIGGSDGLSSYLLGARDESAPLADALLFLGGTGEQPVVGARVEVGFPQIEELSEDRIQLGVIWIGREGDPASLDLFDAASLDRMRETLPHGGVAAIGALRRGDQNLAAIRGAFPLAPDAASPIPQFRPEDRVVFEIKAEPLRLADWQAVLPRGTEIGGELWMTAQGDGPLDDFPVEASIRMEELRYRQSFGNAATINGRIDVSGRSSAPVIRGTVKVPNALVRLPEAERNLHPVEGDARLWKLGLIRRDEFAALDSLEVEWGWAFEAEDSIPDTEPRLTLAEATELDVKVEIPNSFWIRGQGLEVQLAGELHLELRNGVPVVVGELRAVSGQLEVVGARLQLDRGVVTFYDGDTSNPGLDLELSRDIGDVRVVVRVTGTALEPRLAFDSEPAMSQSDIMSYLVFGSSASDLDGAQTQLLQDQAAAALSQFAAPMLENELTQSLGISMMQLRAGENPDEGLSLVVGKYVTPQILLKYEQSLKDRQKYTVNAEYWLSRQLRIETRLSETQSTGIELNWSTDY
jgi:hypothetical protein